MTKEMTKREKKKRHATASGIAKRSWAERDVIRSITGRKRAEEALLESEERWRSLVENIPDIIMTVDAGGTILFINRTVLGFTVEEATGSSVYDYVPPEHHDTLRKLLEAAFEMGEAHEFEIAGAGPFGRTSWYFNRIGPVVQDGRVVAATLIATDITEKRQTEEALRESEERYRHLVENINEAIYELDAKGQVTYISPVVEEVGGYSPSEIVGRPATEFVHPDDLSRVAEGLRRAVSGHPTPNEYRLLSKTGEVLWVRSFGRPIFEGDRVVGIRGVLTDITERKLAEKALRESEARLRAFANAVPDIAFILDENGVYVEVLAAPEMKDLLYANGETIRGRRLHDVLPQKSAHQFLTVVRKTIETQKPQILEYVLDVQAGRRWFEGRTAPLPVPGEKRMVVWVSHDITERKQAEAGRQKAREELDRRAERSAERGNTYGLTFRELAVLDLVSAGKSDREIATLLGIRPRTVSKHVENIRAKMGASSRTEAGVRAVRETLLS